MNSKMKVNAFLQWQTVHEAFRLLSRKDRQKLSIVTFVQITLGFLDLLGVIIIGLITIISVNGVKSLPTGTRVNEVITYLGLNDFKFQTQVSLLATLAAVLLISRTILTMYFTRRILFYLSHRSAVISSNLIQKLLSQDLLTIQKRKSQEVLYAVTSGVDTLFLHIVGAIITLISDVFLLLILTFGLVSLDIGMTLLTITLFVSTMTILYFSVQKRINYLATSNVDLTIHGNQKILEALHSYRDLFVRNRRSFYGKEISESRLALANASAELSFIPSIGKYVIEITLVFGAILLCGIQFVLKDSAQAVTTLSVFLAATSRIAPAILRIQTALISIKSNFGAANRTLSLISDFSVENDSLDSSAPLDVIHEEFQATIELENVSFKYPGADLETIKNASLEILAGEVVAFVGPSGAGKTTIIDLILGLLKPNEGKVTISGLPPLGAINKWPGAMAYVPQDVYIIDGSIRDNVAMGFPEYEQLDELVMDALNIAQLSNVILGRESDLNFKVGENGIRLSGGQRQRLGIARALYLKPKLIILDEATSSLDSQTEVDISGAILDLRGQVTVILIAHRLSTVKNADKIVYMENGKILAIGKFDEVRRQIPNFDKQAALMGV